MNIFWPNVVDNGSFCVVHSSPWVSEKGFELIHWISALFLSINTTFKRLLCVWEWPLFMTMIIACMQLVLKMLIAVKYSLVTNALVIVATKVMELISAMI